MMDGRPAAALLDPQLAELLAQLRHQVRVRRDNVLVRYVLTLQPPFGYFGHDLADTCFPVGNIAIPACRILGNHRPAPHCVRFARHSAAVAS